jgi:3-phenylpropionate/trans-cinnamate dioxygenase ferredoxin reductase component
MAGQVFVIVGASLAGAKAAQGLREGGFDGRVVLIGEEPALPYARPELSKGYLLGGKAMADLLVHPAGFYAEQDIEVRTDTTVTGIDRAAGQVQISGGGALAYDRLLLATGSAPRMLDAPGGDLPGVVSLRTVADADVLRERIAQAGRVVVVGAGWIGCEVAACARMLGAQVTVLTPDPYPLVRVLGPELGAVFADLHTEHGVDLRLGTGVAQVVGSDRAQGVRTTDGGTIAGDLIVVGIGAAPRDELARTSGLAVDNGILVDEFLTTSDPRILAAGDVANAWHPRLGARLRVEHWDNAIRQGMAAAATMLGTPTAFTQVPFFYSDQYDFGMEYRGHATAWDQVVFRGDPASREFLAFWLNQGRVLAAMNANIWDQVDALDTLVRSQATASPEDLANPAVDLAELVPSGGP